MRFVCGLGTVGGRESRDACGSLHKAEEAFQMSRSCRGKTRRQECEGEVEGRTMQSTAGSLQLVRTLFWTSESQVAKAWGPHQVCSRRGSPGTPHDALRATQDGMAPSHGLLSPPPSASPLWSGLTAGLTGECRGFQAFPVSLDVTQ